MTHKRIITGIACGDDGCANVRGTVGTHTGDTKRGWFNMTNLARGFGGSIR